MLNNLGSCYEQLKDHKRAEETYIKALAISSNFEEARLNLSAVYYNQKSYSKAFETIDLCSVNSANEKYKLFLTPILTSWLTELSRTYNQEGLRNFHVGGDEITKLYYDSKKKGVTFEQYILKNKI